MSDLQALKSRLEKLPQIQSERGLAASFSKATKNVAACRERLKQTYADMNFASAVSSTPKEYETKVLQLIISSATIARTLYDTISNDPLSINLKATEKAIIKLKDNAQSAETNCQEIWKKEIDNIVSQWVNLARVVESKIGSAGGKDMKQAIDHIKGHPLPKNSDQVHNLKSSINQLKSSITTLGLDGAFGKFLEDAIGSGANAEDLLNDDIRTKLDEYGLWSSFRVKL